MNVLIACEFSGIVREEFIKLGHIAVSIDLLPTEIDGPHIQGNITQFRYSDSFWKTWDLMIGHPPCTRLSNSGVRWLQERNLWNDMVDAANFFKFLLNAPVPRIVIENPIPHKYAVEIIGRKYDQLIQPYQFSHPETKATCLWLKNLPLLQPTKIVDGRTPRVHYEPPSPDRWKNRSRTYSGIARALAAQYGNLP